MRSVKNRFAILVLITMLGLILAGQATAQTFTVLHSFSGSDGAYPSGGLILSNNTLYGAASGGGSSGAGTVFKVNTDGTGFMVLHNFSFAEQPVPPNGLKTNSDGAFPNGLILSEGILYGTASGGTPTGGGTVFKLNTGGTAFTNLHGFASTNSDGVGPSAGLILSNSTLCGTAEFGGSSGYGSLFALQTDGTGFTNLHNFSATGNNGSGVDTNSDGAYPRGGLILSGNSLYGTASSGGSSGAGTVFALQTDGTGFTNLHSFTASFYPAYANGDGARPFAPLTLSGETLYGTAYQGGSSGNGTVFAVNTDGSGFTNLHSFTATPPYPGPYINSDGAKPIGGLILSGNILYGTAQQGGSSGNGVVFAVSTNGAGFTNLYSFTAGSGSFPYVTNSDGAYPQASLILSGNTLYGTTTGGGSSGVGTVFSLSFNPQLTITLSDTNVILTWPTNFVGFDYTGYTLQSATDLVSPVWSTNSPAPVVVNGQNTVTNPISGTQQFYRLSQ